MRIVSLAPSNTEILFALGAGDQVVACTTYCDYPPEAKKLPKVGGWTTVSHDLVKKFDPDIVLTSTIVQGDAELKFKNEKFKVFHLGVITFDDIYKSIQKIGDLVGKKEEARELVEEMKVQLYRQRYRAHLRGMQRSNQAHLVGDNKPRVYIEEWFDPPMASGNWVTEIIEAVGGVPILKKGEISKEVTLSEIDAFDPDYVMLAYCGYGAKSDPDVFKKRWSGLRAVKDDKVFALDEGILNRPGPRIWQAAEEIKKLLERFHL